MPGSASNDLSRYVLQLEDDKELSGTTLKNILKSVNRVILEAEKQPPYNLMKLLEESRSFEGVGKYVRYRVPLSPAYKIEDCWSLVVVTLTAIAISLPNIQSNTVDMLLSSVSEGLAYVKLVEESLNAAGHQASIQKAAKTLWLEVEVYRKWLGNRLQNPDHQVNTAEEIVQWFSDTAESMVSEEYTTGIGSLEDDSISRSICANSMYLITQTILLSYPDNIQPLSQQDLFVHVSSMIADILAACLTNIPQVIVIKCHTRAIEKREASVHVAAKLLGETLQIINSLDKRDLPNLKPDELAFISNWRDYFSHPFP